MRILKRKIFSQSTKTSLNAFSNAKQIREALITLANIRKLCVLLWNNIKPNSKPKSCNIYTNIHHIEMAMPHSKGWREERKEKGKILVTTIRTIFSFILISINIFFCKILTINNCWTTFIYIYIYWINIIYNNFVIWMESNIMTWLKETIIMQKNAIHYNITVTLLLKQIFIRFSFTCINVLIFFC